MISYLLFISINHEHINATNPFELQLGISAG